MDLTQMPLFKMLGTRMRWLNERQRVLAQNVANADTPGYRAMDLREPDFRGMLRDARGDLRMAATGSGHMAAGKRSSAGFRVDEVRDDYEATPNGNAVVLEEEMMKVTETAADYQMMTNLYKKHVQLIKTAIGGKK